MKTDKEMNGNEESTIEKQEDSMTEDDETGDIAGMKKETNGYIMMAGDADKSRRSQSREYGFFNR